MVRKHTSQGKCCVVALVHLLFLSTCLAQLAWSPIQVDSESKFCERVLEVPTPELCEGPQNYLATVILTSFSSQKLRVCFRSSRLVDEEVGGLCMFVEEPPRLG